MRHLLAKLSHLSLKPNSGPMYFIIHGLQKGERTKKGGENSKGTGVLKEHGLKNSEKRGGMVVLCGTRGRARSLKQDLRVQESGTVMPGSIGWLCQISGSNFQSVEFWHGLGVPNFQPVPKFWFCIFGVCGVLGMCLDWGLCLAIIRVLCGLDKRFKEEELMTK